MAIRWYSLFVLYCFTANAEGQANNNVLISLKPGQQLKGLNTTVSGHRVYKFLGIPYAVPPLGDKRFKPPQPAADWTGVKDAVARSNICRQGNSGSEDCLYLNVFTPDVTASLPVFVWIHGGGYTTGSSFGDGDGATMAPRGVVSVSINYRLGPLGFMSTGDSVMPGNYGMLDQVLALKWVQKYIRTFGGDPNQVTIGGESAGAHSVSLQILSPLSKGLFHRAVMESGSALALTAVERPGTRQKVKDETLRSAAQAGCNRTTSSDILQCLQKVGINELMSASRGFVPLPRVEKTYGFLPDEPLHLLQSGNYNKVDTLHGINSGEWSGTINDAHNNGVTEQEFRSTIGSQVGGFYNSDVITSLFTAAYAANVTDPFVLRDKLVQAIGDVKYGGATIVETNKYVTAPNTNTHHYLYEFYYRIKGTTSPAWQGVGHTGELRFVFYSGFSNPDDNAMGQTVQTMWSNFIIHGHPTPTAMTIALPSGSTVFTWSDFTEAHPNLLQIDIPSKLIAYSRLFLISMFEKVLEIMQSELPPTIVG